MSPLALTTLFLYIAPIAAAVILSIFFKKAKAGLLYAALLISVAESAYLIWEKENEIIKEEAQRDKVHDYLKSKYPGEKFVLSNNRGVFSNGIRIEAVFMNEPDYVYGYRVNKDGRVTQNSYSGENVHKDGRHVE
ncbi:hypothetical protein V1498_11635 [Peribacillus sp. SCS-26]|uniref:hypothetical protein n=1 Tax=Paraperibacillus marinus TaxID=3115295 RepID=UPI003905F50D